MKAHCIQLNIEYCPYRYKDFDVEHYRSSCKLHHEDHVHLKRLEKVKDNCINCNHAFSERPGYGCGSCETAYYYEFKIHMKRKGDIDFESFNYVSCSASIQCQMELEQRIEDRILNKLKKEG